jgi:hypothetical protein
VEQFYKNRRTKDGLQSWCKHCNSVYKGVKNHGKNGWCKALKNENMKWCPSCKKILPFAQFQTNAAQKDGLTSWCKACLKNARDGMKEVLDEVKNQPCADCGGRFPAECMDFDHVNGNKEFNIGNHKYNLSKLIDEIDKCDVVCANCHRIRTRKRKAAS